AVLADDVELAKLLIDSGARVEPIGEGLTAFLDNPLRVAVTKRNEAMVMLLAAHGATTHDPERWVADSDPFPTVLEQAVSGGNVAIVRLLLDHGVPADGSDLSQSDPLAVAARDDNRVLIELLLAHGANPSESRALAESIARNGAATTEYLLA